MDLSADHILVVFLLTTLAGLATGIGGFIAFFMKRTDTKTLTFALGLSGGVMVYISLVELLGEAQHRLIEFEGHTAGSWIAIASFFGGIAVAALIDYLVPEDENPHEARGPEDIHGQASGEFSSSRIKRSGILFALAIGILPKFAPPFYGFLPTQPFVVPLSNRRLLIFPPLQPMRSFFFPRQPLYFNHGTELLPQTKIIGG